jgi:hypothetical protein
MTPVFDRYWRSISHDIVKVENITPFKERDALTKHNPLLKSLGEIIFKMEAGEAIRIPAKSSSIYDIKSALTRVVGAYNFLNQDRHISMHTSIKRNAEILKCDPCFVLVRRY